MENFYYWKQIRKKYILNSPNSSKTVIPKSAEFFFRSQLLTVNVLLNVKNNVVFELKKMCERDEVLSVQIWICFKHENNVQKPKRDGVQVTFCRKVEAKYTKKINVKDSSWKRKPWDSDIWCSFIFHFVFPAFYLR